jgi:CDP-diacylglycerol--glycerol-3-phosphate 3-phosphatidyltransferase
MLTVTSRSSPSGLVRLLPNVITLGRVALLPLFVMLFVIEEPGAAWGAAIVVLIAALSDVADGWLARRFGATSRFGRIVDPLVDRTLYIVILSTLLLTGTLPWWAAVPLIVRDGLLLIGAAVIWHESGEPPLEIERLGKLANFVLICGLEGFILDLLPIGWVVFSAGAALYLATGAAYFARGVRESRSRRGGGLSRGGGSSRGVRARPERARP